VLKSDMMLTCFRD